MQQQGGEGGRLRWAREGDWGPPWGWEEVNEQHRQPEQVRWGGRFAQEGRELENKLHRRILGDRNKRERLAGKRGSDWQAKEGAIGRQKRARIRLEARGTPTPDSWPSAQGLTQEYDCRTSWRQV